MSRGKEFYTGTKKNKSGVPGCDANVATIGKAIKGKVVQEVLGMDCTGCNLVVVGQGVGQLKDLKRLMVAEYCPLVKK